MECPLLRQYDGGKTHMKGTAPKGIPGVLVMRLSWSLPGFETLDQPADSTPILEITES